MKKQSSLFIEDSEMPWEELGSGLKRKILGYGEKIMLVKVAFDKGAVGPIHHHLHSQTTYVLEGSFEVTIGNEQQILKSGDGFYIPPGVDHGAVALEDGILIDVFSPLREDFIQD
ncbi:MAG: cupin domain-containing protein [Proteobacteria bacterium]|nr:cupin domain-containing protein [Pseudomonadota bacterium]